MRIVHIITKGDVGGAQSHVADLAVWQRDQGNEVTVVTGLGGPVTDHLQAEAIDVRISPNLTRQVNPIRDLGALRAFSRELASLRPDVVHAHSSKAGVVGRIAARRTRIPAVYTAHGWPLQAAAPRAQRMVSRAGETVAGHWWGEVICLTPAELDLAERLHVVPAERLHLVPLGLGDGPVRDDTVNDPVRLMMVARFAPPKDQQQLLEVVAQLVDLPWALDLVGDGPGRASCEAFVRQNALQDRVSFLGVRDDVPALLARSDIAVLVSRYEGMPLAVLEALRAGIPIVASDLPGVRTIIGYSDSGVPVATSAVMGQILGLLIADAPTRRRMGALGRQRFEAEYTVDVMGQRIDDVYAAARSRVEELSRPPRGRGRPSAR